MSPRTLLAATVLLLLAAAGPASRPASRPSVTISAGDDAALTAAVDADVILEGDILSAAWSRSGKVMNITFAGADGKRPAAGTGVSAVVFVANRPAFDAAFSGDVAKALPGAHVRAKGKLTLYGGYDDKLKGSKQLILRAPDQLTILTPAAPLSPPSRPATSP